MYSGLFYKLSWNAQFAAGVVLFTLSYLIESYVLTQYLDDKAMALALVGALEVSKALSIVFYRYMKTQTAIGYPATVAALLLVFRLSLLALSIICSVMYLAERLDRPNLERVRMEDLQRVERDYAERIDSFQATFHERRARVDEELKERYRQLARQTKEGYLPAIHELEILLNREMENVVNGSFIGPRYREIERRLQDGKARHRHQLDALREAEQAERIRVLFNLDQHHEQAMQALTIEKAVALDAVRSADYRGDARVENPLLHAMLSVNNAVFGIDISTLQFVFFFSIFLSLIMELGIVVIFEHISLSYMPLFQAEHDRRLSLNKKRIQAEGELQGVGIEDGLLREQVDKERGRIERRMRRATADLPT